MQTKSLRIKSYKNWPIADTASKEAVALIKKLELFNQLKSEECSTVLCLRAIDWSKGTYYRRLNHYRTHDGIGLETPMRYYQPLIQAA